MSFKRTTKTLIETKLPLSGPAGSLTPQNHRDVENALVDEIAKNRNFKLSLKFVDTAGVMDDASGWVGNDALYNPQIYTYNGVIYFAYYDTNHDTFVNTYNPTTGELGTPVSLPTSVGGDYHERPVIIVADSGHVIVVVQETHNGDLQVFRSNVTESITGGFTETLLGTIAHAYPSLIKCENGTICLVGRSLGDTSGEYTRAFCYGSTDDGASFQLRGQLAHLGETNAPWAYVGTSSWHPTGEWACVFINCRDQDVSLNYPRNYILFSKESSGFQVWGNIDFYLSDGASGFSQNIVTGGEIERATLDANYLVEDTLADTTSYINSASFGLDGSINIAIHTGNRETDNDFTHYLATYNGTSWGKQEITGVFGSAVTGFSTGTEPSVLSLRSMSATHHHLYVQDIYDDAPGVLQIRRYVTFDGGVTWHYDCQISKGSVNHFKNTTEFDYHNNEDIAIGLLIADSTPSLHSDYKIGVIGKDIGAALIPTPNNSLVNRLAALEAFATSGGYIGLMELYATIQAGTPVFQAGDLVIPDGSTTTQVISTPSKQAHGTWEMTWTQAGGLSTNSIYFNICVPAADADIGASLPQDCYNITIPASSGNLLFRKSVADTITNLGAGTYSITGLLTGTNDKLTLTRSSSGSFSLDINGTSVFTGVVDTDHMVSDAMSIASNVPVEITISELAIK